MPDELIASVNVRKLILDDLRRGDLFDGLRPHRYGVTYRFLTMDQQGVYEVSLGVLANVDEARDVFRDRRDRSQVSPAEPPNQLGDERAVWIVPGVSRPYAAPILFRRRNVVTYLSGTLGDREQEMLSEEIDGRFHKPRNHVIEGDPAVPEIRWVDSPPTFAETGTASKEVKFDVVVDGLVATDAYLFTPNRLMARILTKPATRLLFYPIRPGQHVVTIVAISTDHVVGSRSFTTEVESSR